MEQNAKPGRLPLAGMLLTTALVLGGLSALLWWSDHRAEIYARRAAAAAEQGDWDTAQTWGEKAQVDGAEDVLDDLSRQKADALFEAGDYAAARDLYDALGDSLRVMACGYAQAEALEQAGDYAAARDAFLAAAGYEDALLRADRCRYAMAEDLLAAGDVEAAFREFLALGDYEDALLRAGALARELTGEEDTELALLYAQGYTPEVLSLQEQLTQKRDALQSRRLAAGRGHALFLTEGGTVRAAGDNGSGQCDVADWRGVIAVAAGYAHSLGLTADGRVLAAGDDSCGQCDVADWTHVVALACGPWDSYGITDRGTVLHCGFTQTDALAGWTDASALAAADTALFAVRQNGSLLSRQPEQGKDWQGLWAVAAAGHTPVGLKKDGTLLSDSRDLSQWTQIVALDSSASLLLGLRLDGTLLAEPLLPVDRALLEALQAETGVIGFDAAGTYVLILHEDGTLSAPGAPASIQSLCAPES